MITWSQDTGCHLQHATKVYIINSSIRVVGFIVARLMSYGYTDFVGPFRSEKCKFL